jgi:hypothetical protein
MASRSDLVKAGDSAVFWDHHIISEQFADNGVIKLLNNEAQPLNGGAFDINRTSNRIYLAADTGLAASLGQTPHTGTH